MTIQYTGNNLKFQMLIIHSSNKLWTKGYGWKQSEDQIPYTTHNFCVPKKQGQGLHIVQDFRELNNHTHIDTQHERNSQIKCIGEIDRANSTMFSTLDLTSRFWQMPLDDKDHEQNYSPFLVEAAAAVWGIDTFN